MRKALFIGIDNYPNSPLNGCVNDATELKAIMKTNGDGSPNFETTLITNIETKGILKEKISQLFSGSEIDTALFYYSGHGFANQQASYLVTPDAKIFDEGLSMQEIIGIVNSSTIKNKIIILDCCYSGAMGNAEFGNQDIVKLGKGVSILTASESNEVAFEYGGHGVFTNLLISALEGGAADIRGRITSGSIYSYIDQSLGAWDQRPVFKTNISKFTPLRTVTPAISDELLRRLTSYFISPEKEIQLDPSFEYTTQNANLINVTIFQDLQKMVKVGLILPVGEEHMYDAAMNSKSCKLTALGFHYWRSVKHERI
jgi:hypothetical protein